MAHDDGGTGETSGADGGTPREPETVILRKAANAMFDGLEPRLRAIEAVTELYEKLMGGVWAGGWLELTSTDLSFRPNALNRAVTRAGDMTIRIPLDTVRDVEIDGGVLTKIISIRTVEGHARLRCWGARAVAARIREAAGLPRT